MKCLLFVSLLIGCSLATSAPSREQVLVFFKDNIALWDNWDKDEAALQSSYDTRKALTLHMLGSTSSGSFSTVAGALSGAVSSFAADATVLSVSGSRVVSSVSFAVTTTRGCLALFRASQVHEFNSSGGVVRHEVFVDDESAGDLLQCYSEYKTDL